MSCTNCAQVRTDLAAAVKAGHVVEAVKIAMKGATLIVKQAPAVARNFGR